MLIPAIGIGVLFIAGLLLYNGLISKKNEVENALGGLDAHLKQRYDLIPNLVSSVKLYMQHEASTLEKVIELRSKALSMKDKQELNTKLSQGLSSIMVQMENYPELKASANFQELQKTLYEVEQNIAASRRFYNSAVTEFNNATEMFPSSIFAKMMGLNKKEIFSIPEAEKKNINIQKLFEGKAS